MNEKTSTGKPSELSFECPLCYSRGMATYDSEYADVTCTHCGRWGEESYFATASRRQPDWEPQHELAEVLHRKAMADLETDLKRLGMDQ